MKVGRRLLSFFTHQKRHSSTDYKYSNTKMARGELTQLHDAGTEWEELDLIGLLPLELRMELLSYFNATDLCGLRLVNRAWKQMVDDERVWRSLFLNTFGRFDKCDEVTWKDFYITNTGVHWDELLKCEHIVLSNSNRIATDACPELENFKWTTALAKPPFKKGRHYCEIEILKCCPSTVNTIKIAFGVCDQIPRFLYNCPFGYSSGGFSRPEDRNSCIFMADGNFMVNSKALQNKKGKKWEINDRIGMLIDCNQWMVRFYHNGEEQACLKVHFKTELHIGLSLINGNSVSIAQYPKYPISRAITNKPPISLSYHQTISETG